MKSERRALALAGAFALLVAAGGAAQAASSSGKVVKVPGSTVKVAFSSSFAGAAAAAPQGTPIVLTLPTFPTLPDTPVFASARARLEAARQRVLARLLATCDTLNGRGFSCTVSPS